MPGPDRQTLDTLARTAGDALAALKTLQRADGHWCAELEGDSILHSLPSLAVPWFDLKITAS